MAACPLCSATAHCDTTFALFQASAAAGPCNPTACECFSQLSQQYEVIHDWQLLRQREFAAACRICVRNTPAGRLYSAVIHLPPLPTLEILPSCCCLQEWQTFSFWPHVQCSHPVPTAQRPSGLSPLLLPAGRAGSPPAPCATQSSSWRLATASPCCAGAPHSLAGCAGWRRGACLAGEGRRHGVVERL